MGRLEGWIAEYAESVVNDLDRSGFSGINAVEKILRDPGFSTKGSRHRVLWWPRNRRIASVSRNMHCVEPISQLCLIVKYGRLVSEDGREFGRSELCANSTLKKGEFDRRIICAKNLLRSKLFGDEPSRKKRSQIA